MESVFIDPLTSFGFQRVFGHAGDNVLMRSFLNAVLRGRKRIHQLDYQDSPSLGEGQGEDEVMFNLTCMAETGEQFMVQVQSAGRSDWPRKMLYHGSKLVAEQAGMGDGKGGDDQIQEVYLVGLLDGVFFTDRGRCSDYVHDIGWCNCSTGAVLDGGLSYICLELLAFTKREHELGDELDRWLYVLKHMARWEAAPIGLRDPIFDRLFDRARYSRLNREEKEMYRKSLKRKSDAESARFTRQRDLEQARAAGWREAIEHIARALKQKALPVHLISWISQLSVEEIEKL